MTATYRPHRQPTRLSVVSDGCGDYDVKERTRQALRKTSQLVVEFGTNLRPDDIYDGADADQLRHHLTTLQHLAGMLSLVTAKATAAYAKAGGLDEDGTTLVDHFRRQGHSSRDAHNKSQLTNKLDSSSETAKALADGDITEDTAVAILGAKDNPRLGDDPDQIEKDLLDTARNGGDAAKVRKKIKREEQRRDGDRLLKDAERQHKLRRVSLTKQRDGMWNLSGLLTAEAGEKCKTLLDSLSTWDPVETPEHEKRSTVQRHADAFNDAMDWMLDHRDLPTRAGRNRPHIVVTVPHDTVHTNLTDPDQPDAAVRTDDPVWADLPPGLFEWSDDPVAPQTVRRFCCDASITHVGLDGNGIPLNIGHANRSWTHHQRTAITVRDGGCRGPSCTRPAGWTEIHHIKWWRNKGTTDLDNGLLLCRRCHNLIHHHNWTVALDASDATATWTTPQGRTIVTQPHDRTVQHRLKRRAA